MKAPGKMSAWITVQKDIGNTQDSAGEPVPNWVTDFQADAEYQPLGSREFPSFQKRYSESTARFRIRYRTVPLDPATNRILYDGRTWNISAPVGDRRRTELLIEASEVS